MLEKDLDTFSAVNERVASARAKSFRNSLINGVDAIPQQSLSAELGEAGLRKLDAANKVDGARQCHGVLSREYDEAQGELATRQSEVEQAARAVLVDHATALRHETRIARTRRR